MRKYKRLLSFMLVIALTVTAVITPAVAEPLPEASAPTVLLEDDFSGDLSKWTAVANAQIVNGAVQIGANGYIQFAADTWTDYTLEFDADFQGQSYRGISFRRQETTGDDYFWWFGDGNTKVKVVKRTNAGGTWTDLTDIHAPVALSGMHHFKLEVNGSSIKAYVDGELYNTGSCADFLNGGILFFVAAGTATFDNVVVTEIAQEGGEGELPEETEAEQTEPGEPADPSQVLLEDDFSGDLSKWNTENAAITDGRLQLGTVGGGTLNALAEATVGNDWTNYTLEFDADFNGQSYRGISFRRQDNGDDYFWWFGDGNTKIKIVKRVGGARTDISDIHAPVALSGAHHFKLEVNGSQIKGYVDGQLFNAASDEAFTTGGILFFVNYDAAWFDNVVVTPITENGEGGGEDPEQPTPSGTLLEDDFSGDLSKWTSVSNAQIVDGAVQIGANGFVHYAAEEWTDYTLEFDADFNGESYRGISFRRQEASGDDYFWWFGDGSTNIKVVKRTNAGGTWTDISDVKPAEALTGMHHFKLEVSGSTVKTYVDGNLYNTGECADFANGGILFFVAAGTATFDNVVVKAGTENGEGGEDDGGETPEPPATEIPDFSDDFSGDLSKWYTENGQIADGRLQLGTVGGGNGNALAEISGGAGWTDYVLEFDADFNGQSYRGISFRRQGNGDDYLWWFGDGAFNIQFVKRVSGGWESISDVQPGNALLGSHHFKLVVQGNTFKGYVDGNLFNTGTDDALTTGGVLFLVTYDAAFFDNVVVRQITDEDINGSAQQPEAEKPDFSDDFSGDLSQWETQNATLSNGKLQLGKPGTGSSNGTAWAMPKVGTGWTDYTLEFDADFGGESYRGISFRRQANGNDYLWWFGDGASNIKIVKRTNNEWQEISNAQPGTGMSGTHHFKLVVTGNTFYGFVDGTLFVTGQDDEFTKGGVLLMVDYEAAVFDNVVVREVSQEDLKATEGSDDSEIPNFKDNFSGDLSNWIKDKATISGGMLQLGTPGGGTLNAYATPSVGSNWTDYVIEFDADFNGQSYRGVSFRRQDNGDDYLWWFGDGVSNVSIVKRVNGSWTPIGNVQPSKPLKGSHHFKIVVKGNTFTTFVDGEIYNIATDSSLKKGGFMFMLTYDAAWFDNVVVREYKAGDEYGKMANEDLWPEANINEDFVVAPEKWDGEMYEVNQGRVQIGKQGGGTLEAYYGPQGGYSWTDYVVEFDADFGDEYYRGLCFRRQKTGGDYMWWFGDGGLGTLIMKRTATGWSVVGDVQPAKKLSGTHHLKLVVKGNQFLTFVDGVICNSGTDDTYTQGGIQFFVNYDAAWIDNVVVRAVEPADLETGVDKDNPIPDLHEDFESGLDGWNVENGELEDGKLRLGAIGGGELYAYAAPLVGRNWTDYVLTVDMNFGGQPYRGISFRRQDNGDDYLLWFGDSELGAQIVKRVGGGWEPISESYPDMKLGGGEHRIKLEVKGSEFKVWVDGAPILTGHDEELKTGGILFFVNYEAAWIDNVSVTVPGEETQQLVPDSYENDPFGVDGWQFEEVPLTEVPVGGDAAEEPVNLVLIIGIAAASALVLAGAAVAIIVPVVKKKKLKQ